MRVRELRLQRGWSQAHLAELTGLSIRTIQRIETGANPGLESLRGRAAAFGVDVSELQAEVDASRANMSLPEAVTHCLRHCSDFGGVANRAEFWWFALAVALAWQVAVAIGPSVSVAVAVLVLVPLLAAATRRLRDAGQSPWWLLMLPVPIGGLVVLDVLLAMPSNDGQDRREIPTT